MFLSSAECFLPKAALIEQVTFMRLLFMVAPCVPGVAGKNIPIYFKGYTSKLNMQYDYIITRCKFT